jgi:hypothetical protein
MARPGSDPFADQEISVSVEPADSGEVRESSGGTTNAGDCCSALSALREKLAAVEKQLEARPAGHNGIGSLLLEVPELRRVAQLSWRDLQYPASAEELKHPDLVRRLAQGYDELSVTENLLHRAERSWAFRGAQREQQIGSYTEWIEAIIQRRLSQSEKRPIEEIVETYVGRIRDAYLQTVQFDDWRVRELALEREFRLKNEQIIAALDEGAAETLEAFWMLRTRMDHKWVESFLAHYDGARSVPSTVRDIIDWLTSTQR